MRHRLFGSGGWAVQGLQSPGTQGRWIRRTNLRAGAPPHTRQESKRSIPRKHILDRQITTAVQCASHSFPTDDLQDWQDTRPVLRIATGIPKR